MYPNILACDLASQHPSCGCSFLDSSASGSVPDGGIDLAQLPPPFPQHPRLSLTEIGGGEGGGLSKRALRDAEDSPHLTPSPYPSPPNVRETGAGALHFLPPSPLLPPLFQFFPALCGRCEPSHSTLDFFSVCF